MRARVEADNFSDLIEREVTNLRRAVVAGNMDRALSNAMDSARAAGVPENEIFDLLPSTGGLSTAPVSAQQAAINFLEEAMLTRQGFTVMDPAVAREFTAMSARILAGNPAPYELEQLRSAARAAQARGDDFFATMTRQGVMDFNDGFVPLINEPGAEELRKIVMGILTD